MKRCFKKVRKGDRVMSRILDRPAFCCGTIDYIGNKYVLVASREPRTDIHYVPTDWSGEFKDFVDQFKREFVYFKFIHCFYINKIIKK